MPDTNVWEQAFYNRHFGMLGIMAKNDIFFQFEVNLVVGFMERFDMALRIYEDWDGKSETYEASVNIVFARIAARAPLA